MELTKDDLSHHSRHKNDSKGGQSEAQKHPLDTIQTSPLLKYLSHLSDVGGYVGIVEKKERMFLSEDDVLNSEISNPSDTKSQKSIYFKNASSLKGTSKSKTFSQGTPSIYKGDSKSTKSRSINISLGSKKSSPLLKYVPRLKQFGGYAGTVGNKQRLFRIQSKTLTKPSMSGSGNKNNSQSTPPIYKSDLKFDKSRSLNIEGYSKKSPLLKFEPSLKEFGGYIGSVEGKQRLFRSTSKMATEPSTIGSQNRSFGSSEKGYSQGAPSIYKEYSKPQGELKSFPQETINSRNTPPVLSHEPTQAGSTEGEGGSKPVSEIPLSNKNISFPPKQRDKGNPELKDVKTRPGKEATHNDIKQRQEKKDVPRIKTAEAHKKKLRTNCLCFNNTTQKQDCCERCIRKLIVVPVQPSGNVCPPKPKENCDLVEYGDFYCNYESKKRSLAGTAPCHVIAPHCFNYPDKCKCVEKNPGAAYREKWDKLKNEYRKNLICEKKFDNCEYNGALGNQKSLGKCSCCKESTCCKQDTCCEKANCCCKSNNCQNKDCCGNLNRCREYCGPPIIFTQNQCSRPACHSVCCTPCNPWWKAGEPCCKCCYEKSPCCTPCNKLPCCGMSGGCCPGICSSPCHQVCYPDYPDCCPPPPMCPPCRPICIAPPAPVCVPPPAVCVPCPPPTPCRPCLQVYDTMCKRPAPCQPFCLPACRTACPIYGQDEDETFIDSVIPYIKCLGKKKAMKFRVQVQKMIFEEFLNVETQPEDEEHESCYIPSKPVECQDDDELFYFGLIQFFKDFEKDKKIRFRTKFLEMLYKIMYDKSDSHIISVTGYHDVFLR